MNEEQYFQLGLSRIATACQHGFGPDRKLTLNEVMRVLEKVAEAFGYPCIDSDQAEDNFVMTFKWGGL